MKNIFLLAAFLFAVHTLAAVPISQDSVTEGMVEPGAWTYYQVAIPADSPGWRLVLAPREDAAGNARLYIRQGAEPTTSQFAFSVTSGGSPKTIWLTEVGATEGTWYVGVYLPAGNPAEAFTLHSRTGWVTDLTWDPGSARAGHRDFHHPGGRSRRAAPLPHHHA
jgi:hypothetical protein